MKKLGPGEYPRVAERSPVRGPGVLEARLRAGASRVDPRAGPADVGPPRSRHRAAADGRRAARGVPQRGHRLLVRRGPGAAALDAPAQDVLDRVRGSHLRRERPRARDGPGHRLRARRGAPERRQPARRGRRRPEPARRAARQSLVLAHLPAVAPGLAARQGRAGRRRRRRAVRRLPHVQGARLRAPRAASPPARAAAAGGDRGPSRARPVPEPRVEAEALHPALGRRAAPPAPALDVEPRPRRPRAGAAHHRGRRTFAARRRLRGHPGLAQPPARPRLPHVHARLGAHQGRSRVDGPRPRGAPAAARQRDDRLGVLAPLVAQAPPRHDEVPAQARGDGAPPRGDHPASEEGLRHSPAVLDPRADASARHPGARAVGAVGLGAARSRRLPALGADERRPPGRSLEGALGPRRARRVGAAQNI